MKRVRMIGYPVIFGGGYGWIARSLDPPVAVWVGVTILGLISGFLVWRREYPAE